MIVDRFTFALRVDLILGDPKEFEVRDWPMTSFAPDTMITNAPCAKFVELSSVQVDATELCYSSPYGPYYSLWDAFGRKQFTATPMHHGARALGKYTGIIPAGYSPGYRYCLTMTFQGNKL
jgi:hypothetical protein